MNDHDAIRNAPPRPPESASRSFRIRRVLVGAMLAATLLWRAGDAMLRGGAELVRRAPQAKRALVLSEKERIRDALRGFETEFGYAPGELGTLYDVFAAQIRFDDVVVVVMDRFDVRRAGIVRLAYHLYPIRLQNVEALPADGLPDPALVDAHSWPLEIDPGPPQALAPWFEEVARGPSFALWRGRDHGP